MKNSIAIYGSHDSNIAVRVGANEYRSYELERITGVRNYSLSADRYSMCVLEKMRVFLNTEHGIAEYDSIFYGECNSAVIAQIREIFKPAHMEKMEHHAGHAACALWQSPFDEALIVSFDGGGNDNDGVTYFNIYLGNKKNTRKSVTKLTSLPLDICSAYTLIAKPLKAISKKDDSSYLSWAGKIMGLVAYGKVRQEWIGYFSEFYYKNVSDKSLSYLFNKIGLSSEINSVDDFLIQADVAATSQQVFEDIFINALRPFIGKYDLPVCLTGGGALNVLLNQKIHDLNSSINRETFIPCNPNDSGLALGFMLLRYPPDSGQMDEIMYSGFPLMDSLNEHNDFVKENFTQTEVSVEDLARLIASGMIIGVIQGNSEVGPRALGNRSILCCPNTAEIKDEINNGIKFREPFRPFAPVVLEEDSLHYFFEPHKSKYMTYSQQVKHIFSDLFPAVTHKDDTARVQTVSEKSNPVLYEILTTVKKVTGHGVLMNTSFNSKGKPILTTHREALEILKDTTLDAVWINGILFEKK